MFNEEVIDDVISTEAVFEKKEIKEAKYKFYESSKNDFVKYITIAVNRFYSLCNTIENGNLPEFVELDYRLHESYDIKHIRQSIVKNYETLLLKMKKTGIIPSKLKFPIGKLSLKFVKQRSGEGENLATGLVAKFLGLYKAVAFKFINIFKRKLANEKNFSQYKLFVEREANDLFVKSLGKKNDRDLVTVDKEKDIESQQGWFSIVKIKDSKRKKILYFYLIFNIKEADYIENM